MKQLISFVIAIMAICLQCLAETISYSVDFDLSKLKVDTVYIGDSIYSSVSIDSTYIGGEPGDIAVPYMRLMFALPAAAKNIELSNCYPKYGSLQYLPTKLMAVQEPYYPGLPDTIKPIYPDTESYVNAPKNCKATITSIDNFHYINKLVQVTFPRFGVHKKGDRIVQVRHTQFKINYTVDEAEKEIISSYVNKAYLAEDAAMLASMVVNPQDIASAPQQRAPVMTNAPEPIVYGQCPKAHGLPVYEYCIITNKEMKPAFERLIALKEMKGIDAGIVCMEDILENEYFQRGDTISNIKDDAGCLRQYLLHASRQGTRYALLGGRPPIVPVRYGTPVACVDSLIPQDIRPNYHIPTDLYYSEPSSNWNTNNNEFYGECDGDNVSYIPGIWVGRLLCSSKEEVENYLDKLEIYELIPGFGDYNYLKKAFSHCPYGFYDITFDKELYEKFPNAYTLKFDYGSITDSLSTTFSDLTQSYQNYYAPKASDVIGMLNTEHPSLIYLVGHGSPVSLAVTNFTKDDEQINALDEEPYPPYLKENRTGFTSLQNFGYPSVLVTNSCNTIAFDSPSFGGYESYSGFYDCFTCNLGQSFTFGHNYGGIAYFGSTRAEYTGPAVNWFKNFVSILNDNGFKSKKTGVMEGCTKMCYQMTELGERRNIYVRNLLGDPSAEIWYQTPQYIPSPSIYNVDVSDPSWPLNNYNKKVSLNPVQYSLIRQREPYLHIVTPERKFYKYQMTKNVIYLNEPGAGKNSYYMTGYNCIPPRMNNIITPELILHKRYFYCQDANIGNFENNSLSILTGDFHIKNGCYTIDAINDVTLNKIVVENGAELKILTKTTCNIKGLTIEAGGTVNIQADSVKVFLADGFVKSGELKTFKYDKYREHDAVEIEPIFIGSPSKSRHTSDDYYPFVEQGKTWKYTQRSFRTSDPDIDIPDDYLWEYRIEDAVEIDGQQWHKLNWYRENRKGELVFQETRAYLLEDIPDKKVWAKFRATSNAKPYLLYDFSTGKGLYSWNICGDCDCVQTIDTKHIFKAANGTKLNSVIIRLPDEEREFMVTQGLGFLMKESECNEEDYGYADLGITILSLHMMVTSSLPGTTIPWLYEITAGDGTVLYTHDAYRRQTTDGVDATPADKVEMVLEGKQIKLSAPAAIGRVMVFDASGYMIRDFDLSQSTFTIDTTGYMPGLYIVKAGSETLKVTVK
jgi:hypothetical protein